MLIAGSVLQIVPDMDVVAGLWMTPAEAMVFHRGFTHSFFFALMFALFTSAWLPHSKALDQSPGFWLVHVLVQLIIHDVLDAFNAYGTAWFLPFDESRISFHGLYVADPFFSLGPAAGIILFFALRKDHRLLPVIPYLALVWCGLFLVTSLFLRNQILARVQVQPELQQAQIGQTLVTPMPFSSLLWFVAVPSDGGYFIGYRSVFEMYHATRFRFIPKNEKYAEQFSGDADFKILKKFSGEDWLMTLIDSAGRKEYFFTDLRFGIRPGWNAEEPVRSTDFVFRYPIGAGTTDRAMLQHGRMSGLDQQGISALLRKIFNFPEPDQSPR